MSDNKNEVKEIDLLELFQLIGKGIKNFLISIAKVILFLVVFGIKRTHWLVIAVVAGGLIGYLFFETSQRYYSSNLVAQPNGISATDMVEYINDLNKFTKKGNTPALSYSLDLQDSVAKKIKKIEAFYYLDVNKDGEGDIVDFNYTYNPKDTNIVIDDKKIYVQVEVFDNKAFGAVREGLFQYIGKNPYLLKLNELRKNELKELVDFAEGEIRTLDSLQKVDYFQNTGTLNTSNDRGLLFLSEKDKQMYYYHKERLTLKKQGYIKELEMATAPLTIIKDFTALSTEENPRGGYIIKYGFWFGVFGYIFLLLLKHKSNIIAFMS